MGLWAELLELDCEGEVLFLGLFVILYSFFLFFFVVICGLFDIVAVLSCA